MVVSGVCAMVCDGVRRICMSVCDSLMVVCDIVI